METNWGCKKIYSEACKGNRTNWTTSLAWFPEWRKLHMFNCFPGEKGILSMVENETLYHIWKCQKSDKVYFSAFVYLDNIEISPTKSASFLGYFIWGESLILLAGPNGPPIYKFHGTAGRAEDWNIWDWNVCFFILPEIVVFNWLKFL